MRFLLLYDSTSLNVTQYSNAYALFSVYSRSIVLNHSQMLLVRNHSNAVVVSELSWISLCVCVRMYVMFVSIWWDLFSSSVFFCYIFLRSRSLFLFSCLVSVRNVVVRSSLLFVLLSLVCSKAVIIVIREIYKFDDRLDNDGSVQAYYRLTSMCREEGKREDVRVSIHFISCRNDSESWHS